MGASPIVSLKVVTVVLAIVTAILGCVSHFQSSWTKQACFSTILGNICFKAAYKICELPGAKKCPHIGMERYFVAMVIICCILSIASLAMDLLVKQISRTMRIADSVYHVFAANLLLFAAVVYFVSTEQIHDLSLGNLGNYDAAGINFRRSEKLAAAALTLIQGILCAVTAFLIIKKYIYNH